VTWAIGNRWSDAVITPDGSGTYNITRNPAVSIAIAGAPEGIAYVAAGTPLFPAASVLIALFGTGEIVSYQVNANGDPITSPNTRKTFVSGLDSPMGVAVDPLTISCSQTSPATASTASASSPSPRPIRGYSSCSASGWSGRSRAGGVD